MPSFDGILLLQYAIPVLLPLFLLLVFHGYQSLSLSTRRKKKNLPPSPPRFPIIGNLHQLGRLPHQGLRSLSQKYGDVMLLHLGSRPTLVVSSAEAALQVMKTHDVAFCSKPRWSNFTRIFYNGKGVVSAPYGDYWRHMRSICVHQLLSNQRVHSFSRVREEEVARMVDDIKRMISSSSTSSVAINMREMFLSQSNDLVSMVAMGMRNKRGTRRSNDNEEGFDIDVEELMADIGMMIGRFSVGDFVPWLAWIDRFTGNGAKVDKIIKTLDDFLEGVLAKHSIDKGKGREESGAPKDFVDVLLHLQNGADSSGRMGIDRESIKALLLDMFGAGTETTATTLEWMMSEILVNHGVLEKLQQEVKGASKGKKVIKEDDLNEMVYLKAVIQETLRMHPPVPLSPHECIKDVQVNGYDIAAGTLLFSNAWAIGRDPRYWDEPESFHPERFLDSSTTKSKARRHEFGMIPFGSGRRGCPGISFANANMELEMANLILQFNWALPYGVEREKLGMQEHPGITTRRRIPLVVVVSNPSSFNMQHS